MHMCMYIYTCITCIFIMLYILYYWETLSLERCKKTHLPQRRNQRRAKIRMPPKSSLVNQEIYCGYLQVIGDANTIASMNIWVSMVRT